jgi:hypothetical protein
MLLRHSRPGLKPAKMAGFRDRCVFVRSVGVDHGDGVSPAVQHECIRNASGDARGGEVVWREGTVAK